jgi:hypothetical protein
LSKKTFAPNTDIVEPNDWTLFYGFIVRRNLRPSAVTVTGSATAIPATNLASRYVLVIQNLSSDNIYVGDITVTTANGLKLVPNAVLSIMVEDSVQVYGISDGTSSNVRILEGS